MNTLNFAAFVLLIAAFALARPANDRKHGRRMHKSPLMLCKLDTLQAALPNIKSCLAVTDDAAFMDMMIADVAQKVAENTQCDETVKSELQKCLPLSQLPKKFSNEKTIGQICERTRQRMSKMEASQTQTEVTVTEDAKHPRKHFGKMFLNVCDNITQCFEGQAVNDMTMDKVLELTPGAQCDASVTTFLSHMKPATTMKRLVEKVTEMEEFRKAHSAVLTPTQ